MCIDKPTTHNKKKTKQQKNQRRQNNDDLCVSAQIRKKIPNAHSSAHFPTHLCISRHSEELRFIAALMCIYIACCVQLDFFLFIQFDSWVVRVLCCCFFVLFCSVVQFEYRIRLTLATECDSTSALWSNSVIFRVLTLTMFTIIFHWPRRIISIYFVLFFTLLFFWRTFSYSVSFALGRISLLLYGFDSLFINILSVLIPCPAHLSLGRFLCISCD